MENHVVLGQMSENWHQEIGAALADFAWRSFARGWTVYHSRCARILTESEGQVPHVAYKAVGDTPVEAAELTIATIHADCVGKSSAHHVIVLRDHLTIEPPNNRCPHWSAYCRLCIVSKDDAGCWPISAADHAKQLADEALRNATAELAVAVLCRSQERLVA